MRQDINHENRKYWDKHILEVIKASCRLEVKEEVPVWARYRLFCEICIALSIVTYISFIVAAIVRNVPFEWKSCISLALLVGFIVDFFLYLISVFIGIISRRMKAGRYISAFFLVFLLTRAYLNILKYKGNNILALSIIVPLCSCIVFKIIYVISLKLKNK